MVHNILTCLAHSLMLMHVHCLPMIHGPVPWPAWVPKRPLVTITCCRTWPWCANPFPYQDLLKLKPPLRQLASSQLWTGRGLPATWQRSSSRLTIYQKAALWLSVARVSVSRCLWCLSRCRHRSSAKPSATTNTKRACFILPTLAE